MILDSIKIIMNMKEHLKIVEDYCRNDSTHQKSIKKVDLYIQEPGVAMKVMRQLMKQN